MRRVSDEFVRKGVICGGLLGKLTEAEIEHHEGHLDEENREVIEDL